MRPLAMIAFGGNALLRSHQKGTYAEQLQNIEETCNELLPLLERGYHLVIGHGNGPQVGNVLLQHEAGAREYGLEVMPMDVCGAETQGAIGYLIENALDRLLTTHGIHRRVISLVTRVEVYPDDPMFSKPTKPIGPYYSAEQAAFLSEKTGAVYREDAAGRGWPDYGELRCLFAEGFCERAYFGGTHRAHADPRGAAGNHALPLYFFLWNRKKKEPAPDAVLV